MTARVGERMDDFEGFYATNEPRLRRALVAALGPARGREATAEALAYAWQHWDRIRAMEAPVAYLYRVGQSKTRERKQPNLFPSVNEHRDPWVEPALPGALDALSEHQRVCVVLAHGFGWTHQEIAELLEISRSTVQNHVERGLARLRNAMEVSVDDRTE
jgi:DNA-directed RNA polymerase specialized sigma24 family protein